MSVGMCPRSRIQGSGDNGENTAALNPHPAAARTTRAISGPPATPLT